MITPYNKLPLHIKEKYLINSKGSTSHYPNDFYYADTPQGHNFWWNVLMQYKSSFNAPVYIKNLICDPTQK